MKYISYIWTLVQSLIALFISIAILGKASTPFETIVFCLLILLYIAIQETRAGTALAIAGAIHMQIMEFLELKKLIKHDPIEDDAYNEEITKMKKRRDKDTVKFIIVGLVNLIIFIIVLWNLFQVI
jgi:hypothetical protein